MPYKIPKKASLFVTLLLLFSQGAIAEEEFTAVSINAINQVAPLMATDPKLTIALETKTPKQIFENNNAIIIDTVGIIKSKLDELEPILQSLGRDIIRKNTSATDQKEITELAVDMYNDIETVLSGDINILKSQKDAILMVLKKQETISGKSKLTAADGALVQDSIQALYNYLNDTVINKLKEDVAIYKARKEAEAEAKAKEDAIRSEAEAKAKAKEDARAKAEAEAKAKAEAELRAIEEAAAKAKAEELKQLEEVAAAVEKDMIDPMLLAGGTGVVLLASLLLYIYNLKNKKQFEKLDEELDYLEGMHEDEDETLLKNKRKTMKRNIQVQKINRKYMWIAEAQKAGASREEAEKIAEAKENQTAKPILVNEEDNRRRTQAFYKTKPYSSLKGEELNLHDIMTEEPLEKEIDKELDRTINTASPEEAKRIIVETSTMNYKEKIAYINNGYKVPTSTCSIQ
jgi:hypothetical protein